MSNKLCINNPKKCGLSFDELTNKVVFLHGGVGSGKTTLVSQLIAQKNKSVVVTSPTFCLINFYQAVSVLHVDLFRLQDNPERCEDIAKTIRWYIKELQGQVTVFVEWPNPMQKMLKNDIDIYINEK